MPTCGICGGFYDEYRPCQTCAEAYRDDVRARHVPPGLSLGALTIDVWRRIKSIELRATVEPEVYPEERARYDLQKLVEQAEADYQKRAGYNPDAKAIEEQRRKNPIRLY